MVTPDDRRDYPELQFEMLPPSAADAAANRVRFEVTADLSANRHRFEATVDLPVPVLWGDLREQFVAAWNAADVAALEAEMRGPRTPSSPGPWVGDVQAVSLAPWTIADVDLTAGPPALLEVLAADVLAAPVR